MSKTVYRYTMKAIGPDNWRDYDSCEIGISIGNPNHDGHKFRSILLWAAKRFDKCIVTLSDTLNRYTVMCDGTDEAMAYFKTRKTGDKWLADNHETLREIGNQLVLHRWEDWLGHPEYEKIYNDVRAYRDSDPGFLQALKNDACGYLDRRAARDENFDYERGFRNSLDFFVEEIACYVLITRTYGALRAYPAKDMHCFDYMRGPHVPAHLKGMENAPHLELNFKKKVRDTLPDIRKAA